VLSFGETYSSKNIYKSSSYAVSVEMLLRKLAELKDRFSAAAVIH